MFGFRVLGARIVPFLRQLRSQRVKFDDLGLHLQGWAGHARSINPHLLNYIPSLPLSNVDLYRRAPPPKPWAGRHLDGP